MLACQKGMTDQTTLMHKLIDLFLYIASPINYFTVRFLSCMSYQFVKLKASNTEIVESQMRRLSVSTLFPPYSLHSRYGKALTKIFF